jgi:hypothetical protein
MNILIDDVDEHLLSEYKWRAVESGRTYYFITDSVNKEGARSTVRIHRLIMGSPSVAIDHINGHGWDNRRVNLRLGKPPINQRNKTREKLGKILPIGVFKDRKKYRSQITVDGKTIHLGMFDSIEDAYNAYKKYRHNIGFPLPS